MTYQQSTAYLLSLLGNFRGAHFGLARTDALLERLGRPERACRVVHVAGTNGKGSTCAMIEAGLRAAGRRTGFYSSPHLSSFRERFRIDGSPIAGEEFAAAVDEVRSAIEAQVAAHGRAMHPTMFETITAAAFCAFRSAAVEWAVVEVGLGGRLDATNVVRPELAVITAVDLDHEVWLGSSLAAIAGEKAGILKRGSRAVFGRQHPEVATVLHSRAAELDIPATSAPQRWKAHDVSADAQGRFRFTAAEPGGVSLEVRLGIAGEHQVDNALTAAEALAQLGVTTEAVEHGLHGVEWPGRLERIDGPPPVLLDAAHNPAGARGLAAFLSRFYSDRRVVLVYGTSRDKAVDEVAGLLFPAVDRVILTRSAVSRSVRPEALMQIVDHHHTVVETAPSVAASLELARRAEPESALIVIAGSIFLVGEARALLLGSESD